MGKVGLDKSMSLDGYITGPNPGPENPLEDGGERVFSWMMADQTDDAASGDQSMLSEAYDEVFGDVFETTGAVIMGSGCSRSSTARTAG